MVMLVAVAFLTGGDILLAQGMRSVGEVRIHTLWETGVRMFTTRHIWAGIAFLLIFLGLWLYVLTWAELSWALPLTALTYVLNALLAGPLLGEEVSVHRWAGTLLIVAGVVVVTLSYGEGRKR